MKAEPINDQKQKEHDVLKQLREGNKGAFEEIFRHYWKGMFAHAYSKLHSREIAEEIVQEIFTTLWARREELLITNLSYYLHTSVKNRVMNHIRSLIRTRKHWEQYRKFIPEIDSVTEKTVNFEELKGSVEKSIDTLPEKARKIFQLNRIEGYSVAEIAKKLNVSEKVVEYHITSSVKKLRVQLRDYLPQQS